MRAQRIRPISLDAACETAYRAIRSDDAVSAGRILVVDDDPQIRRVLKVTLTGQGYEVDEAKSGEAALEKLRAPRFDVVLLDVNMPGIGGLETCRAIRDQSDVAIVMLTVSDREADTVEALDAGADDYVTKPFQPSELAARIRAAMRRTPWAHSPAGRFKLASVEIDFDTREVLSRGRHLHLTPREFDLLRFLVSHPNRVLTHREILHAVWGYDRSDDLDALRVVVTQLRKKLEVRPDRPAVLLTEPWVGYRLSLPSAAPPRPTAE